ncbi:hypothetical protein ACSBR2_000098 [Camellia fascicularis]
MKWKDGCSQLLELIISNWSASQLCLWCVATKDFPRVFHLIYYEVLVAECIGFCLLFD